MPNKEYDLLVYIGRFQPFHRGHKKVVDRAIELADNLLILVGSCNEPRSVRNPFTFDERSKMISSCTQSNETSVFIRPLEDHKYNDEAWVREVQQQANKIVSTIRARSNPRIGLIGFDKDHTSYYLKMFPNWETENVEAKIHMNEPISSTPIRIEYFTGSLSSATNATMPDTVSEFMHDFMETNEYENLCREMQFVQDYKRSWEVAPYAPTFVTTDAVVVQSGHVLLVKRRAFPGKGLWALPGGFLNQGETLLEGCIRELREETKIKVPAAVLRGSIVKQEVFDEPNRSSRGRTITHAFFIELEPAETLPKVKGSDDAEKAKWVPLSDVTPAVMFEDHFHILRKMTGV